MIQFSFAQINAYTQKKHFLVEQAPAVEVEAVISQICGLHATAAPTPYLSLWARFPEFKHEFLDAALYDRRSLGRIRCMRKTLYLLPKQILADFYKATIHLISRQAEKYLAYRGVTWQDYLRFAQGIEELLGNEGMTAAEIRRALGANFDVPAVVSVMSDLGRLARGEPPSGWRSTQYRYYRFATYFPDVDLDAREEGQAVQEVVRAYLSAFGPVFEADIVWWTGLGKTKIRRALDSLEAEIDQVGINGLGDAALVLRSQLDDLHDVKTEEAFSVHLLPALDPYLMGYHLRDRYLDPEFGKILFDRSGNIPATIWGHGRVAGVWDAEEAQQGIMKLFFFESLPANTLQLICRKAEQLGLFISGQFPRIVICEQMKPLKERTAGGFMTPLRGS
jgi:hypothetical protein